MVAYFYLFIYFWETFIPSFLTGAPFYILSSSAQGVQFHMLTSLTILFEQRESDIKNHLLGNWKGKKEILKFY